MSWQRCTGLWRQLTGEATAALGRLTGNAPAVDCGRRQALEGKLQRFCGYSYAHARRVVDVWSRRQRTPRLTAKHPQSNGETR